MAGLRGVCRQLRGRFVIGAPLYALSIWLALVSAPACLSVNALLAVYYALPGGGAVAHASEELQS
jgi:hypothetical protein